MNAELLDACKEALALIENTNFDNEGSIDVYGVKDCLEAAIEKAESDGTIEGTSADFNG